MRELLDTAEDFGERREREEARRAQAERERQARLAAAARAKHLDALAGRESELWFKVQRLAASREPKSYDVAVQLLLDLRELAARTGDDATFAKCLAQLREAHARKPTLLKRLEDRGL